MRQRCLLQRNAVAIVKSCRPGLVRPAAVAVQRLHAGRLFCRLDRRVCVQRRLLVVCCKPWRHSAVSIRNCNNSADLANYLAAVLRAVCDCKHRPAAQHSKVLADLARQCIQQYTEDGTSNSWDDNWLDEITSRWSARSDHKMVTICSVVHYCVEWLITRWRFLVYLFRLLCLSISERLRQLRRL